MLVGAEDAVRHRVEDGLLLAIQLGDALLLNRSAEELADRGADGFDRSHDLNFGRHPLAAEEFDDGNNLVAYANRYAPAGHQAIGFRALARVEPDIAANVLDPDGCALHPDLARQTFARSELGDRTLRQSGREDAIGRHPHAAVAQHLMSGIGAPQLDKIEAKMTAQGRENARQGVLRGSLLHHLSHTQLHGQAPLALIAKRHVAKDAAHGAGPACFAQPEEAGLHLPGASRGVFHAQMNLLDMLTGQGALKYRSGL